LCKNYIACDDETRSEVVIPVLNEKNEVLAVFDIDSITLNRFDEIDIKYLQEITKMI
jgi:L-methionine (R)-S-oxide reductase